MRQLILIRHAESTTNAKGVMHKAGDKAVLTEAGAIQAMSTAKALKQLGVALIITSQEVRAVETAEILAGHIGTKLQIMPGLHERNWGDWSGKPWSEVQATLSPMDLDKRYSFNPPGGESWRDFEYRLRAVIERIETLPQDVVAVVSHGGVLRALMPILLGEPKEGSFHYDFQNASITALNYVNGQYSPMMVGDTSHLAQTD